MIVVLIGLLLIINVISLKYHIQTYNIKKSLKSIINDVNNNEIVDIKYNELERCLRREYATFFSPLDKKYYVNDVEFIDPLNSLKGIDNYQKNIDLLAGRTTLGSLLFKDASINLHNIIKLSDNQLQTRWTLQLTVKFLPWQPRPKFTGISIYTINSDGKIVKQEDYWDSINLKYGKYNKVSFADSVFDFISQVKNDNGAEMSAPELPYELLRRGQRYEVRRYPERIVAQTKYSQRPEGYDRIGSYCSGSNVKSSNIFYYSPTLMKISDDDDKRIKIMEWPLSFVLPGQSISNLPAPPEPTIPRVDITTSPEQVVAVTRFELAATEPIVKGYTNQLLGDITNDGLKASTSKLLIVGQYDALFSLNKRRNEVWIELDDHPWK